MNLHPKILAAAIAALVVGVVDLANAVANVYPGNTLVELLMLAVPVVVGYLKSAETKLEDEAPAAPTTPPAA